MPTARTARPSRVDPDEVVDETAPFDTDDEEPEPRPTRRGRAAADPVDEEPIPTTKRRRAKVDEEPQDEEPDGQESVIPVSRGRKAIKESRVGGNELFFKWGEDGEGQVVKFLADDTDELAWSYNSHWVERAGKKSFPCIGKNCPLCEIGNKASQKIVYTVLNLSHPDGPKVQVLEVTPTVDDDLYGLDTGKTGPLTRLSWEASRPKKQRATGFAKYNYTFTPVKDRDLGDDYDIDIKVVNKALDEAEIPGSEAVLGKVSARMLQEIADEVVGQ